MIGLILLIFGDSSNPPSIGILVIGGYFVTSAIISAVLVTIVEPKIRPKPQSEENQRLTTIKEEKEEEFV
jgi:hypothetical protein